MVEALLTLLVFSGVLSFIINPLLKGSLGTAGVTDDLTMKNLEQEKFNVYAQIKEADFEYEMGKLSYRDYRYQRQELMQKAAEIIDEIESHMHHTSQISDTSSPSPPRDSGCPECASPVKPGAKFCAICGTQLGTHDLCAECGAANPKGSKFCGHCGEGLVTV